MTSLVERQLQLEEEMLNGGQARYWRDTNKARETGKAAQTRAGNRLVMSAVEPLSAAIQEFLDTAVTGGPGRLNVVYKYIKDLEADVMAYIAIRRVIDTLTKRMMLQATAFAVGGAVEDEARFRSYREQNKSLFEVLARDLKRRTNSPEHQRRVIVNRMNKAGVDWEPWGAKRRIQVGVKLIDLLIETTGLVFRDTQVQKKRKRVYVLRPSEDTLEWMRRADHNLAILQPAYMPMVIEPEPWTDPTTGGYLTKFKALTLVKTSNWKYHEELATVECPEVYDAVNRLQSVPWKINSWLYDIMREAWDGAASFAGLPARDDQPLPPRNGFPHDVKAAEMTPEELVKFKEWKRAASHIHAANAMREAKEVAMHQKLAVAGRFKEEEAFWFPHSLDWRGRAYPLPLFLNPQADDSGRALLEFSDGKPLGEQGAEWLAIHGANMWGEDKVSLENRIAWVQENEQRILQSAQSPFEQRWWTDADKPWQFLAFCLEWFYYDRDGRDHVCHLPIHVDGTCNGLQNFAAMLLDEKGGEAVNLVPSDKPQDVYQRVADNVGLRLETIWRDDVLPDSLMAHNWLCFGINRKTVKRPVMTLPYGATKYGFREQLISDTMTPARQASPETYPFSENERDAAKFLAEHIWDAIEEEIVSARKAMDWLQEVAVVAAENGLPVFWHSPLGLPVIQQYRQTKTIRLETSINKRRVQLAVGVENLKINKRRQRFGIAPNFVHSCDAAHMMSVVNLLWANLDEPAFAAIHDSFATHACDMWVLHACIREAFVDQYKAGVLEGFEQEIRSQLSEEHAALLPPLPAKGDLDLDQVRESDFFFA